MDQIINKIESGISDAKSLLVIEGWRLEQIADAANRLATCKTFKEQDFLKYARIRAPPRAANYPALKGLKSMEGLLFPATYLYHSMMTQFEVIDILLNQFTQVATDNDLVAQAKQHGLTEYQIDHSGLDCPAGNCL